MENITWLCDGCGEPVTLSEPVGPHGVDGDGYLHVDVYAAQEVAKLLRAANRPGESWAPVDVSAVLEAGEARARWQVHHRECDSTLNPFYYRIETDGIDTWPKVLERTLDLHAKAWFMGTDWPDFLGRRVLSQA